MNTTDTQLVTRFDDIYNLPDCRAYYREMHIAQYRNAHFAVKAFKSVLLELKRIRALDTPRILDFASGYGIGALLLRHDISLDQVLARYQDTTLDDLTSEEVIKRDKSWFEQHKNDNANSEIFAIDVADQALAYGQSTGIFDAAFAIDLQKEDPGKELTEKISRCDLIIEVGSVAHMLPDALAKILKLSTERLPWIITSPIRGNESRESIALMEDAGMKVEMMPIQPFQHRKFLDEAEQKRAITLISSRGLDPEGYETEGAYHAQLYLARQLDECTPVSDWLIQV